MYATPRHMQSTDLLIDAAVAFHRNGIPPTVLPPTFGSLAEALSAFSASVCHEAHESMSAPVTLTTDQAAASSVHAIRAAVDLDGDSPGLWVQTRLVLRGPSSKSVHALPKRIARARPEVEESRAVERVEREVNKRAEVKPRAVRKKRIAVLETSTASCHKASSDMLDLPSGPVSGPSTLAVPDPLTLAVPHSPTMRSPTSVGLLAVDPPSVAGSLALDSPAVAGYGLGQSIVLGSAVGPAEVPDSLTMPGTVNADHHWCRAAARSVLYEWRCQLAPDRPPSAKSDTVAGTTDFMSIHDIYASPVPFVRMLEGLGKCALHPSMRAPLLRCRVDNQLVALPGIDGVRVVHGPPGTGKTRALLDELRECFKKGSILHRVLITAPSNQAVDQLARAALELVPAKCSVLWTTRAGRAAGKHRCDRDPTRGHLVVFCTVSGRSSPFVRALNFDACLVDEAGLVPDAALFGLLRSATRRLVLVGDHDQLRALTSLSGRQLGHDRSTMERLVVAGYPCEFLSTQHRMDCRVADIVSRCFYHGRLTSSASAGSLMGALNTVDVPDSEAQACGTSWCNPNEARIIARIAKTLSATSDSVAVLAPYSAQVALIRALIDDQRIEVLTVDAAQGREWTVTAVCTVRVGTLGFFDEPARALVAITRSRGALWVVGHRATWAKATHPLWKELATDGRG